MPSVVLLLLLGTFGAELALFQVPYAAAAGVAAYAGCLVLLVRMWVRRPAVRAPAPVAPARAKQQGGPAVARPLALR